MTLDYALLDIILKLISSAILIFGIWAIIEQYTSGRLISQLEIRLHYFTVHDGERILHIPPLGEPKVWEIFDTITALWILYRARAWAKSSEGGRILNIPGPPIPQLNAIFPSRAQMFQRLRIHLQTKGQQPGVWIRRASDSVGISKVGGMKRNISFFLPLSMAILKPRQSMCMF